MTRSLTPCALQERQNPLCTSGRRPKQKRPLFGICSARHALGRHANEPVKVRTEYQTVYAMTCIMQVITTGPQLPSNDKAGKACKSLTACQTRLPFLPSKECEHESERQSIPEPADADVTLQGAKNLAWRSCITFFMLAVPRKATTIVS